MYNPNGSQIADTDVLLDEIGDRWLTGLAELDAEIAGDQADEVEALLTQRMTERIAEMEAAIRETIAEFAGRLGTYMVSMVAAASRGTAAFFFQLFPDLARQASAVGLFEHDLAEPDLAGCHFNQLVFLDVFQRGL